MSQTKKTVVNKKKDGKATARSPLTRERAVAAALAIVDRDGLKALTMRALGAELGVDPMTVYRHFRNKDELLDAFVEAVWLDIELPDGKLPGTWQEQFKEAFRMFRDVLRKHPHAVPVLATRLSMTPSSMKRSEFALAILIDGGLSPVDAMFGLNAAGCYVVGCVLSEVGAPEAGAPTTVDQALSFYSGLSPTEFPSFAAILAAGLTPDFDHSFDKGMDIIVRGLETLAGSPG